MSVCIHAGKFRMASRFALLALGLLANLHVNAQAPGGGVAGQQVRLVRTIVGAKAESRNGAYLITDRRTAFYVPDDREVIVYFEWEGPRRKHHCEANARGPQGAFTVMSSFDYDSALPRFAGHWKMPLSDSTPAGDWVFASKVDGQAAGEVTFQVVAGTPPGDAPKVAPLPTLGELYKLAMTSGVQVQKLDAAGKVLRVTSGFFDSPDQVFTTFMAVDGAKAIRLRLPDGKEIVADGLLAWNRHQDWAVVAAKGGTATLKFAEPQSWSIGDPCYWFDVKGDGTRVLSSGQVVGVQARGSNDALQYISSGYSAAASGGPLLDARGHVLGILGGLRPEGLISRIGVTTEMEAQEVYFATNVGLFIPINLMPQNLSGQVTPFNELWARNEMMAPMTNTKYVAFAMLRPVAPKGVTGRREFAEMVLHRDDGGAELELVFANAENLKSTTQLSLYDLENHRIAGGDPQQLTITKGRDTARKWDLPLSGLPAGFYRVDVAIGQEVAWRQFFKLAD